MSPKRNKFSSFYFIRPFLKIVWLNLADSVLWQKKELLILFTPKIARLIPWSWAPFPSPSPSEEVYLAPKHRSQYSAYRLVWWERGNQTHCCITLYCVWARFPFSNDVQFVLMDDQGKFIYPFSAKIPFCFTQREIKSLSRDYKNKWCSSCLLHIPV